MEDKYPELDLYQLTDHVKNKWSIWYADNEIMHHAPPGAPDWVKKAWIPIPHVVSKQAASTHTVDCSPDGVVLEGGPQHGKIMPKTYGAESLIGHEGTTPVGIYELKKQTWNYNGYHYHRLVYLFKPASPQLKLKKEYPAKKLVPEPNKYEMTKHAVWSGYLESEIEEPHYPTPEFSNYHKKLEMEYEEQSKEYHKSLSNKLYNNKTFSSGPHTGTISFAINEVNPETMKVLYGESAKLDPWAPKPEEEDEAALWDLI